MQVSKAEDARKGRASHKTVAANHRSGQRVVIGDDPQGLYLARINELEEEVRSLKAELAKREASIFVGAGEYPAEPPSVVTADGTKGMQRGVSGGRSRSAPDTGMDA